MSRNSAASFLSRPVLPLYAGQTAPVVKLAAVVLGTALLAVSSWVQVPMVPVPITLQTLAVTLIGAFYGWRLGSVTILAWLAEAALGFPVLASGAGPAYMAGPTGGYLLSFVVAAAAVGWAAERRILTRSVAHGLGVMLIANALILVIGGAWLARLIGIQAAIANGVTPFIIGGIVKAALAAAVVEAASRTRWFNGRV